MKLSRLYTNRPIVFSPIEFTPGLNVILAEIRLPENKKKDTHNLGKTTLGQLIDFCLLSGRDPAFFLFAHPDRFGDFVFFLEVELLGGSFLTIRRAVTEATKINLKRHSRQYQDFSDLSPEDEGAWDHAQVGFEKAKELLDGILDLRDLKTWPYRKIAAYLLRTQADYGEVFHLKKFQSSHADWKPFLAQIMGFEGSVVAEHYAKGEELAVRRQEEDVIKRELGGSVTELSKIEGMTLLKQKESDKKQRLLDAFDFRQNDKIKTKAIVDDLNSTIARLNAERYTLSQNQRRISSSLEDDEILFDPKAASELFRESGVVFGGQIKKDFEQLITFNRAITDERRSYLAEELGEIEADLKRVNAALTEHNKRRAEILAFLSETDAFVKYKQVTAELVALRADILSLERQRTYLRRLQDLRATIRALEEEKDHLRTQIETDVEAQNADQSSKFSVIRVLFSDMVEEVIARKALLSVTPNLSGHLDFNAEILDEAGNATSAAQGTTCRKLLCIAFDLALLRAHLDGRFPRFVFHDGLFEAVDNRKKENLLALSREVAGLGVQHIITLIDSDLPARSKEKDKDAAPVFAESEVILHLHDEGESGRLFKMKPW